MALNLEVHTVGDGTLQPTGTTVRLADTPSVAGPKIYFGKTNNSGNDDDLFSAWTRLVADEHKLTFGPLSGVSRRAGTVRWTGSQLEVTTGDTPQHLQVRPWGARNYTTVIARGTWRSPEPRVLIELGSALCNYVLMVTPDDDELWTQPPPDDAPPLPGDSYDPNGPIRNLVRPEVLCVCRRERRDPGQCTEMNHTKLEQRLIVTTAMHLDQLTWPPVYTSDELPKHDKVAARVAANLPKAATVGNITKWTKQFGAAAHNAQIGGFDARDSSMIEVLTKSHILTYPDVSDLLAWINRD